MSSNAKRDLSDYTIAIANLAQTEQYHRAAFDVWARGKTFEDWEKAYDECMCKGDWMKNGGAVDWALVRRNNAQGEAYSWARTALIKEPGAALAEDAFVYTITGVVTPGKHLRNGFATHLLRLLHYQLASPNLLPPFPDAQWGPAAPPLSLDRQLQIPRGICSVLYSIVGPTFYEKVTIGQERPGWVVDMTDSLQLSWTLRPPAASASTASWDWIYTRDLPAVGKELSATARQRLESEYSNATGPVWMIDPASPGVLSYIPSRVLRPRSPDWTRVYDTEPVGVRLPCHEGGDGQDAIVLFANALALLPGLLVTYVHNLVPEQLPQLLQALDVTAAMAGTRQGLVWGITADSPLGQAWLSQEGRDAKLEVRGAAENLLAVAWYGDEERRGRVIDTQLYSLC